MPNRKTPIILDKNGQPIHEISESWENFYESSYNGRRGLTKGQYLNDIYIKHGLILGDLSEDIILEEMISHLRNKRCFPNENSGQVNDYIAETWHAMNSSLLNCRRGITEKSSLPQMIRKFVLDQGEKHKLKTGAYPTNISGPLPDYPDLDWALIETSLPNRGTNVRPENRKTLPQFFEEYGRLPAHGFTEELAP